MPERPIHLNMKMSDVVHRNYMIIPTLDRFGIRLGFGDKTVKEISNKVGVDAKFLVELLNAFINPDYKSSEYIKEIDVLSLISYLQETHRNYLQTWVIKIEGMILNLKNIGEDENYTDLILKFFKGYRTELKIHIEREEKMVFPYIKSLCRIIEKQEIDNNEYLYFQNYSAKTFEEEHDDITLKLKDLKNIMIKYIISPDNSLYYYEIIQELFKLEEDVEYHSRVEDKILIPRMVFMEDEVKRIIKKCIQK